MLRVSLRSLALWAVAGLALVGAAGCDRATIVTGTVTKVTDNGDGTATAEFTSTNPCDCDETPTVTQVTLDKTTVIHVNGTATTLSDFVSTVGDAPKNPTQAQYSGTARIEFGETIASRVTVSNTGPSTTVSGTITALTDNRATDGTGTVAVEFTSTNTNGIASRRTVKLNSDTAISVNDTSTTLSDFVDAVNKVLGDSTQTQYSGSATIATAATIAASVSVSNASSTGTTSTSSASTSNVIVGRYSTYVRGTITALDDSATDGT